MSPKSEKLQTLVCRNRPRAVLVLGFSIAIAVFAFAAHSQEPPAPIRDVLEETIERDGVDAAIQEYRRNEALAANRNLGS